MTAKDLAEKICSLLNASDFQSLAMQSNFNAVVEELTTAIVAAYEEGFKQAIDGYDETAFIQAAVKKAYEDCAKIADRGSTKDHGGCDDICGCACADEIADAIRAKAGELK